MCTPETAVTIKNNDDLAAKIRTLQAEVEDIAARLVDLEDEKQTLLEQIQDLEEELDRREDAASETAAA
jgi:predicted nuclease with TOPRIM domain